ncbi:hypothetical protein R1flu_007278 [Riccia fluitans]|uniref:Uncharacterized protein n=1 Tax=Riccia fluitans TaxID=41844 RepID=A0ABD1Z134_9MARC
MEGSKEIYGCIEGQATGELQLLNTPFKNRPEALVLLLNCVADKNYDESLCIEFLKVLWSCVEGKHVKNFALIEDEEKHGKHRKGKRPSMKSRGIGLENS